MRRISPSPRRTIFAYGQTSKTYTFRWYSQHGGLWHFFSYLSTWCTSQWIYPFVMVLQSNTNELCAGREQKRERRTKQILLLLQARKWNVILVHTSIIAVTQVEIHLICCRLGIDIKVCSSISTCHFFYQGIFTCTGVTGGFIFLCVYVLRLGGELLFGVWVAWRLVGVARVILFWFVGC